VDLLAHEPTVRLSVFLAVFGSMAVWELRAPRRPLTIAKPMRWVNNVALAAINTALVRLVVPVAATALAAHASAQGWGLLNVASLPDNARLILGIVILDLAIYFQHVLFHGVPLLWRLHRVHHADLDFDVTTGARFHPLEILLSMGMKGATILAFGPPALAVLIFEVALNASSMFNHANVRLPPRVDCMLRLFAVTPDMHRVHHSVDPSETNSNFGFTVSLWDRVFGTYRAQPAAGHAEMTLGVRELRDPRIADRLDGMLCLPFTRSHGDYAINRRPPPSPPGHSA
jgi:sterol desaturase/sphingolipid hydroxylase (fatty acid hydroxylase superfamily)